MRILLVSSDQLIERELAQLLGRGGHETIQVAAGGDDLLSTVEEAARFHVAVLDQSALGEGWPKQVRQLRRRAPYLPAIVLLAPGGEHAWRHAILAGAFEALPLHSTLDAVLEALSRALSYSTGKPLFEAARTPSSDRTGVSPAQLDLTPLAPFGLLRG